MLLHHSTSMSRTQRVLINSFLNDLSRDKNGLNCVVYQNVSARGLVSSKCQSYVQILDEPQSECWNSRMFVIFRKVVDNHIFIMSA